MARGLEAAHAAGITHRDLKPENVFLVHLPGEPPMVKLLDFGLAKLRVDVDRRAERTQSGVAIGTPMYMSPEQARGAGVDHRTDIYALGAVAYELVLGRALFPDARTAPELYAAHLHEAPPLPRSIWPEIPPQIDLALFAMVAKDPAYRPTLGQIRSVLAGARVSAASPSQRAATELVAPKIPERRSAAVTAITAVALLCGIAIGAALSARSSGGGAPADAPAAPVVRATTPTQSSSIETPPPIHAPIVVPPTAALPASPPASIARRPDVARPMRSQGSAAPIAPPTPIDAPAAPADVAPAPAPTIEAPAERPPPAAVPEKKIPTSRPARSIDPNQTINPFKRKVNQ
jgi:eukaryotic-like serine/threonine-protein kinase